MPERVERSTFCVLFFFFFKFFNPFASEPSELQCYVGPSVFYHSICKQFSEHFTLPGAKAYISLMLFLYYI